MFRVRHEKGTMSGIILNVAELSSYSGENFKNKVNIINEEDISESESGSESENETKSEWSSDNNKVCQNIQFHSNAMMISSKDICMPNCSQSASQNPISEINPPHIGNVSVQNSSQTMFGNKTIYRAPVIINKFFSDDNSEKDNNCTNFKRTCIKKTIIVCVIVIVIVIAVICSLTIALKLLSTSENNESPSTPSKLWEFL